MAADTRPFKSKEQDGHGNEVIIRDQQLVEQTSQTTMASGEYFEIVDVDGRMAKIPKDNMIGVVREALGTLLNGLADQTTVTKALTLNGDTLGASTAATLASVLGALVKSPYTYSSSSNLDNQPQNTMVICNGTTVGTIGASFGVCVFFAARARGFQMFYSNDGIYTRMCEISDPDVRSWEAWKVTSVS